MKKIAGLLIGFLAFFANANAQVELMPFVGYTFGDRFYAGRIGDGLSWGGVVSYPLQNILSLEFTYSGQYGKAESYNLSQRSNYYDVTSTYLLLGASKNIPLTKTITSFGGTGLGVAIFSPDNKAYNSITKFGVGMKAGLKFHITETIGIFVQANANFPVTGVNADVWWSTSGGPDAGLSTRVPFTQFGFSGGLVFKLAQASQKSTSAKTSQRSSNVSAKKTSSTRGL